MNRGSNWPQYHATTAMLAPQYEYLVTERQQLDFYRFWRIDLSRRNSC